MPPARANTYVALMRGINLGSRKKIKMSDLKALFEALGHSDVTTYVQSGNVVFSSPPKTASALPPPIEERIAADLGHDVAVLIRTPRELAAVVEANPFLPQGGETSALYVTFLVDRPDASRLRKIDPPKSGSDQFRAIGREIHLHCPGGYGRTKLNNAFWEKKLGLAATTRNWKTVTKLLELARG